MIDSSRISVVISGPVLVKVKESDIDNITAKACQSVRRLLPEAEIVISTWEKTNCSGLDFDIVVFNEDPGPNINNVNRQIISRCGGIKAATREFVLAIRSESKLVNTNFLNFIDQYNLYDEKYRFLKNRVIIPAACPPRCGELFHIGDWYYFGYKEDVLNIWELSLMDDKQFNKAQDDLLYNAHRYLITTFIQKYMPLTFYKKKDINKENREVYEKVLVNNFVIIGLYEYGVRSMKYILDNKFSTQMFHYCVSYTYSDWKSLYNSYIVREGEKLQCKRQVKELFGIYVYCPLRRIVLKSLCQKIVSRVRRTICGRKKISSP